MLESSQDREGGAAWQHHSSHDHSAVAARTGEAPYSSTRAAEEEDLDKVARGVAEAERDSWIAVKQGDLNFVEENVFYLNIHGRLYSESFGEICPSSEFIVIAEATLQSE